jgi:hypothetical protein
MSRQLNTFGAAVALMCLSAAAHAQVVRPNQIVAQSNFVDRNARDAPQVSIVARADFVLFSVSLETGTRAAEVRRDELARTFKSLTDRAVRTDGVSIEVGAPGRSAALETAAIDEIIEQRGPDRSGISVVVRVNVRDKETFDQLRSRTEKFVKDTPLNGRVEAIIGDSQFLGMAEPTKHRATLIKAIAEDTRQMQSAFGDEETPVAVSLTGLENRVLSRPVGPLDLEIYIPYSMSLVSGEAD